MATAVLADINEKIDAQIKSITVEKIIDPLFDLKDLAVFDNNPTQCKLAESDRLDQLARDNAQLIFNQLFDRKQLERTVIDDAIVVTLPDKTKTGPFACPREKPLPKKKPQTKWEAFAAVKGINAKKKKSRMVWCEVTKSWKPRWGYMSAKKLADVNKNGETKDWVREMRPGDDMEVDPWTKEQRDKKERVAKNEHARLKNVGMVCLLRLELAKVILDVLLVLLIDKAHHRLREVAVSLGHTLVQQFRHFGIGLQLLGHA